VRFFASRLKFSRMALVLLPRGSPKSGQSGSPETPPVRKGDPGRSRCVEAMAGLDRHAQALLGLDRDWRGVGVVEDLDLDQPGLKIDPLVAQLRGPVRQRRDRDPALLRELAEGQTLGPWRARRTKRRSMSGRRCSDVMPPEWRRPNSRTRWASRDSYPSGIRRSSSDRLDAPADLRYGAPKPAPAGAGARGHRFREPLWPQMPGNSID
jgi:hypothetical protein